MQESLHSFTAFITILNPIALCLYLGEVMEDLDDSSFNRVMISASGLSLVALGCAAILGEPFLRNILHISPQSLRIFGGIIFLVIGYNYVTRGFHAAELLRGHLDELPSAIALPYMIGAGTITQAILIGKQHPTVISIGVIGIGLVASYIIVMIFYAARKKVRSRHERVFDRYMNILCRMNGLIIGAFSTEMIVMGIREVFTCSH